MSMKMEMKDTHTLIYKWRWWLMEKAEVSLAILARPWNERLICPVKLRGIWHSLIAVFDDLMFYSILVWIFNRMRVLSC
jgi:hypothetical protein